MEAMVPNIEPFERHPLRYDIWFEIHKFIYESELQAVKELLPKDGEGFEIGVGSGRFAQPLGIRFGIEPSGKMREMAWARGIEVVDGVAEKLPLDNASFDFAVMVTTICFLDDTNAALKEAYRVLKPRGSLIIGFVDRESLVGQIYQKHKAENVFYRHAKFLSVGEVIALMEATGFFDFKFTQTIFRPIQEIHEPEAVKDDFGEGSFVVVRGVKS